MLEPVVTKALGPVESEVEFLAEDQSTDQTVTKITGRTDGGHQPRLGLPRR